MIRPGAFAAYRRKGDDIVAEFDVAAPVAVLGGKVEVRTLRGRGYRMGVPVAPEGAEADTAPASEGPAPRLAIERRLAALISVDVVAYSRHASRSPSNTASSAVRGARQSPIGRTSLP